MTASGIARTKFGVVVLLDCVTILPATAAPARRALPPPAIEAAHSPVFCAPRDISSGFRAVDAVHTAARGELIVPRGDYGSGLHSPQSPGVDDNGIYDIAFLGINSETATLELRDYPSPEERTPTATQVFSYPVGTRSMQLRHIVVSIVSVSTLTMIYTFKLAPAAADLGTVRNEGGSATEEQVNDYCKLNSMPAIDVAWPPTN